MKFNSIIIQIFWLLLQETLFFSCYIEQTKSFSSQVLYETKYFRTNLDHFTFKNDSVKFNLKYLISTKHWSKGNAILFYCGNEENIEFFSRNSGYLWELGQELSAIVVFAEHRYYGSSLPFREKSFISSNYFGYLTIEQVLADYATLLTYLKSNISGAAKSPVIVFGGSYGGMLAAWFRLRYPNIVAGSIASSAPFSSVANYKNCSKIYQVLSEVYRTRGSKLCAYNIRRVWPIIRSMNNHQGLRNLTKIFHLCHRLDNVEVLINYLDNVLFKIGVANIPYEASIEVPLPAWPVHEFCKRFSNNNFSNILSSFYSAIEIYGNYTGKSKCLLIETDNQSSANAWDIQVCMELPIPMCRNGISDIFFKENSFKEEFNNKCLKKYGVRPRSNWIKILFSENQFQSASNIIFSNGLLDPWSAGGICKSSNKKIHIIKMPNGAHHVDLRKSHPMDTLDIKSARKLEKFMIKKWIKEWHQ